MYNDLITRTALFPEKAFNFYRSLLNVDINREAFTGCFDLLYNCTSNTKLLDFQYRLLHNAIITNIQLKQWQIKDDDRCTFCEGSIETIDHLFLNCSYSRVV